MADQETLDGLGHTLFDPMQHGLWRRYHDADGRINEAAWLRAIASHEFVGTCRQCGAYLTPQRPEEVAGRKDFEAHCQRSPTGFSIVDGRLVATGCGWIFNAPDGRRCERSSRWSEQPRRT